MKTDKLSSENVNANGVNPLLAACTFFLCSQEVIDAFPECEHSKPFSILEFVRIEQEEIPTTEQLRKYQSNPTHNSSNHSTSHQSSYHKSGRR
jgi:hypothetical protein